MYTADEITDSKLGKKIGISRHSSIVMTGSFEIFAVTQGQNAEQPMTRGRTGIKMSKIMYSNEISLNENSPYNQSIY